MGAITEYIVPKSYNNYILNGVIKAVQEAHICNIE